MQSTYDYLVDQIMDLNAYVDNMSMHEMDRDVLETYIKSIKMLAVEVRDFADRRDNVEHVEIPDSHFLSEKNINNMLESFPTIRKS